jgi:hypothetical protein
MALKNVRYRTQEDAPAVMLPSGCHVVDKHGTIHAPRKKTSKKERNRLKRLVRGD